MAFGIDVIKRLIELQNIPESIFGGSQSSQTDFDTTPSNRSRGGFFQFDSDQINEARIEPQSPRKQMKRTITVSMDSQACSSPLKTRKPSDPSTCKKFCSTDKPETMEKEENENGATSDSNAFPKRALPAGLAESFRAVFAAFLWHEGLVYDAMACSSYLKFHPTLPKRNALTFTNDAVKADPVHLSKYEFSSWSWKTFTEPNSLFLLFAHFFFFQGATCTATVFS